MKKVIFLALLAIGFQGYSQIDMPAPSPASTITQEVGLNTVTIAYSRPSAKGRTVFGNLVPFDEMWRTGANRSTKLTFTDSVTIGTARLAPGSYSLFTVPGASEWMIVISKQVDLSGTSGYDMSQDAVRLKAKVETLTDMTETFTMQFANVTGKSADIELVWEKTRVRFTITSDPDATVMANITAALNPSATDYFQAARYYFESGRDLNQALTWINKSVELAERFFVLKVKSEIQAALGDYKGAIVTANRSTELASAAGNKDYVKMNDDNIKLWSAKVK